jgi:hypothetical protein
MQLPTKDGIACDVCGLGCRYDFTYYSYDFRPVEVYGNVKPPLDQIVQFPVIFSLDVCPACFDKHKKLIVANFAKIQSPKRRVVIGTPCDLSGRLMTGTYSYYHVAITKVDVRATQKPPVVKTDERYVEMNITDDMYKQLTTNAGTVRKVAGEWSTNS